MTTLPQFGHRNVPARFLYDSMNVWRSMVKKAPHGLCLIKNQFLFFCSVSILLVFSALLTFPFSLNLFQFGKELLL